RFERLREGIQDYEKIRLLRIAMQGCTDKAAREALKRLNVTLSHFTYESVQQIPAEETVREGKMHLVELSRALGAQSHGRSRR
ncbi:MAG: hypothetical protein HY318_11235, partial [Armatimonadetes bacterium]|nr:hypothetical protein [Armatimonadota bacterium]